MFVLYNILNQRVAKDTLHVEKQQRTSSAMWDEDISQASSQDFI